MFNNIFNFCIIYLIPKIKYTIEVVSILFFMLLTYLLLQIVLNVNWRNTTVLTFFICIILYYIINFFFYFFSINKYSKLTSLNKYYWIRVFSIIWMLEFFLFFIFLFIYIIAPNELKFFFDPTNQNKLKIPNLLNNSSYILIILSIVNVNLLHILITHRNSFFIKIITIFIIIITLSVFCEELRIYYYYSQISLYQKKNIEHQIISDFLKNDTIVINDSIRITKYIINLNINQRYHIPSVYLLNIMLIVKFLHLYFIILINLFIFFKIVNITKNKISIELFGSLQQMLTVVLIFWSLNYIIFFKYIYKYVDYGFYINSSMYDLNTFIVLNSINEL